MNKRPDLATKNCKLGWHSDPDNSGMCIYCCLVLDPEPNEDANSYRRSRGWPDVPSEPQMMADHIEDGKS